jgi:hypothetical protein
MKNTLNSVYQTSPLNPVELLNLNELESNKTHEFRVCCPKCFNDTVVKKSYEIDIPRTIGFIFFLGASFAIIIVVNLIIMLREKIKFKNLPRGIKDQVKDNKISLLGLHIPTKTKIECNKCEYIFFENYDTGDFIVVFIFFFIVVFTILAFVYFIFRLK